MKRLKLISVIAVLLVLGASSFAQQTNKEQQTVSDCRGTATQLWLDGASQVDVPEKSAGSRYIFRYTALLVLLTTCCKLLKIK